MGNFFIVSMIQYQPICTSFMVEGVHSTCIDGVLNIVRLLCTEVFLRNKESFQATQRAFRTHSNLAPRATLPSNRSVSKWIQDFRRYGKVVLKNTSTRAPTVVTAENVDRVRVSVEESPGRSTRRRSQALGISRTRLQFIMKKHLKFHPYKMMIVQRILLHDPVQRLEFCQRMLNILQDDLAVIINSDKAHFQLDGHVNKQNCRFWVSR